MSKLGYISDLLRDDDALERASIRYSDANSAWLDPEKCEGDDIQCAEIIWRCRKEYEDSWFDRSFYLHRRPEMTTYSFLSGVSQLLLMLREAQKQGERDRGAKLKKLLS